MRSLVPKILVAALAILFLGACEQKETLLSLAAGTTEGTWHPIGGAIGRIINLHVAGIRVNVESTGGGVENVRLLGTNQADIGLCIAATALNGYQGTYPYNQSFANLRTLISSFQLGLLQVAVLEASPLESVEDIHGQRIAVGPAGHGSIPRQQEIYEEMGISFESFTPIYLPFRDALQALGDRRLDAAVVYQSPPAPSLIEFGVTNPFRLLPVSQQYRERLTGKYPYFVSTVISRQSYHLSQDVPTIATANVILVREEIPEETVYQITRAILEHVDEFRSAHPSIQEFQPEMAVLGQVVPYHPGAERYFREVGLLE
ncbi:MAG: TAXI family TRAP transporter solute-binding subunit [Acidobacteria bacterium]|nr:TAXI family TRAP transporter solute-binding subunit [Acidobacteriota bacterium]